jgi:hypothetical protein
MGRSHQDHDRPHNLHGPGLLQSLAASHGMTSILYVVTNLLTTMNILAFWYCLSDPEKAHVCQDT